MIVKIPVSNGDGLCNLQVSARLIFAPTVIILVSTLVLISIYLWSTAGTPFMQVPCTGAHDRKSGSSSFKTYRAHDDNFIKNLLAWLHIATGFPDANVVARNHARRWQQKRLRVCHRKNWKWIYFLNILTFCSFGQTQLSSSCAFSGDVYTPKPKPSKGGIGRLVCFEKAGCCVWSSAA